MMEPLIHPLLPDTLPLLTMSGLLLFPKAHLPLNIFEPHHLSLIEYALKHDRLIGLIQPTVETVTDTRPPLYQVGCAGKVVSFTELDDNRFLVNLLGTCRFTVKKELPKHESFRIIQPDWEKFGDDYKLPSNNSDFDRTRLTNTLKNYFKIYSLSVDWNVVQSTPYEELISSLAMICPLPPNEKQALLEVSSLHARLDLLVTLLEMASLRQNDGDAARH